MPVSTPRIIYRVLRSHYGHQHWWPGDTPFEIILGAILTQSCSWSNVEKAIMNIKHVRALSPKTLIAMPLSRLASLVRPSGYFNQKAKKIRAFLSFFSAQYGSSIARMKKKRLAPLREELLSIWGVGKETADSILCYALSKPALVIDAYTRRLFHRLGHTAEDASYDELQDYLTARLPRSTALYNDFHAQVVIHCKDVCRTKPKCDRCTLSKICRWGMSARNRPAGKK